MSVSPEPAPAAIGSHHPERAASRLSIGRIALAVIGAIIGLAGALAYATTRPERYESTVQLLVGPIGAERTTLDAAGLLTRTYAELLTGRGAVDRAAASLGIDPATTEVVAVPDDRARVILVVVRSDDRTTAPLMATALVADLIVLVDTDREGPGNAGGSGDVQLAGSEPNQVRVLDSATNPARPVTNLPLLVVGGATVAGAAVGLALGSYLSSTRRRAVTKELAESSGLAWITLRPSSTGRRGLLGRRRTSWEALLDPDIYDLALHQLITAATEAGPVRSIALVPVSADIDADLLADRLAAAAPRLGYDIWVASAVADSSSGTEAEADRRLPGDGRPGQEMTGITRVRRLIDSIPPRAAVLVAAPAINSPRAQATAVAVERVALVIEGGRTRRHDLVAAISHLTGLGAPPIATVEIDPDLLAPLRGPRRPGSRPSSGLRKQASGPLARSTPQGGGPLPESRPVSGPLPNDGFGPAVPGPMVSPPNPLPPAANGHLSEHRPDQLFERRDP